MTQLELPLGESVKTKMKSKVKKTKKVQRKSPAAAKVAKRAPRAQLKPRAVKSTRSPRLLVARDTKVCNRCKTKRVKSPRSTRCPDCQAAVRKKQLLSNNQAWRDRVRRGKAGHHVVYKGKPSKWAKVNRMKAVAQARDYTAPSVEPKELKKLLKLA